MNAVSTRPGTAAPTSAPSAHARLASRFSGSAVSTLIHGTLIVLAFLSVGAPRSGRGGGVVGTSEAGSGSHDHSAIVQRETPVEAERSPDARQYPQVTPEPPETPDAVVPPTEDFLKEQSDNGTPVAKAPPVEDPPPHRPKRTYEKLPPPSEGESAGGARKGNSAVNGTGGDTGGAGDGTVGALFMPSPDYPASARRKGIEGVVIVTILVHPDGHCDGAQVVEGSGCDALDDAALTTIRKWRYEPHSKASAELRRVRFVFKLN